MNATLRVGFGAEGCAAGLARVKRGPSSGHLLVSPVAILLIPAWAPHVWRLAHTLRGLLRDKKVV